LLAIALAFGSSVSWGLADFLGGLQARKNAVLTVLALSQAAGFVGVTLLVVFSSEPVPSYAEVAPASLGALGGIVALGAFYRALAIGTMSIVAPISATGAVVPVVFGLARGDEPATIQFLGILVAIVGVILASREAPDEDETKAANARQSVVLALVAAVGFGSFLVALDHSTGEAGAEWALFAARMTSFPAVAIVALLARSPRPGREDLPALVAIGILDAGANGLFAVATTHGLLSIVGVLGSLYPVATVILARALLKERVRRIQEVGVVAALAGVGLIAAG
jgi:drug/metabolite transporter (DMT)-like permease